MNLLILSRLIYRFHRRFWCIVKILLINRIYICGLRTDIFTFRCGRLWVEIAYVSINQSSVGRLPDLKNRYLSGLSSSQKASSQ